MVHIAPLAYVWYIHAPKTPNAKPIRVPAQVQTRQGGAYRIETFGQTLLGENQTTRVVQRHQLVRVTPKTAGAFHAAGGVRNPLQAA